MNYLTNLQLEVHGFHFLVGVPQLLLVLKAPPACRVVIVICRFSFDLKQRERFYIAHLKIEVRLR